MSFAMTSIDDQTIRAVSKIAVLMISSDTVCGRFQIRNHALAERTVAASHAPAAREDHRPLDVDAIPIIIRRWIAHPGVDVVIIIGGTGSSPLT